MGLLKAISALILALPEILKLIKQIQAVNRELKLDRKIQDDFKNISQAFHDRNAQTLNNIFKS